MEQDPGPPAAEYELNEDARQAIAYLARARRHLDEFIEAGFERDPRTPWEIALVGMAWAVRQDSAALDDVTRTARVRGMYAIGRGLFETLVNALYIFIGGDEVASKAQRHAKQRSYRNLSRDSSFAGSTIRVDWGGLHNPFLNPPPDIQQALEDWTTKNGRENRDWTAESVTSRIEAIHEECGGEVSDWLHFLHFMLYRDASEILHGSYYGVVHSLGLTGSIPPGIPPADMNVFASGHVAGLLFTLATAVEAYVVVLARKLELPALAETAIESREYAFEVTKRLNAAKGAPSWNDLGWVNVKPSRRGERGTATHSPSSEDE